MEFRSTWHHLHQLDNTARYQPVRCRCDQSKSEHNIHRLLKQGVHVTINSDDPSYFGGYMNDNFLAVHAALNLSNDELKQLAINSFEASFIDSAEKQKWIATIQQL